MKRAANLTTTEQILAQVSAFRNNLKTSRKALLQCQHYSEKRILKALNPKVAAVDQLLAQSYRKVIRGNSSDKSSG